MGLGFSFSTKVNDYEHFQDTLNALANDYGYLMESEEGASWVHFCRLGTLILDYEEDDNGALVVNGTCQTNLLGAGFHVAAIAFVERLADRLGSALDLEDETDYYTERDFGHLKLKFSEWLQALFDIIKEQDEEGNTMKYICWNVDNYMPVVPDDMVASPFGFFSISDTLKQIDEGIEPLSETFFMWNNPKRDASFHLRQALQALWEDCYFMPSRRSPQDEEVNGFIIRELELAIHMDPTISFPMQEYYELCMLHAHQPIPISGTSRYESDGVIGYRRDWVGHKLGNVTFEVPGRDLVDYDEEVQVFYDDGFPEWNTIRCSAYGMDNAGLPDFLDMEEQVIEEGDFGNGKYRIFDLSEEEDEDGMCYPVCSCHVVSDHQYSLFTISGSSNEHLMSIVRRLVKSLRAETPKNK